MALNVPFRPFGMLLFVRSVRLQADHRGPAEAADLAARGKSPFAFGERGIPPRGVAQRSNTPGILAFRAWRSGRIVRLGATTDFHHGLLGAKQPWEP